MFLTLENFHKKMLNDFSADFRTIILLKLTKSIIEQTDSYGLYELKKILTSEGVLENKGKPLSGDEIKKRIKTEVKKKLNYSPSKRIQETPFFLETPKRNVSPMRVQPQIQNNVQFQNNPQLNRGPPMMQRPRPPMPQQRARLVPKMYQEMHRDDLPDYLNYLKPTKTMVRSYPKLDKLDPFVNDPNVVSIETEGSDEMVYVNGKMGKKPTGIKLTSEEIDKIIDTFSKLSKIPKKEGLFKISTNNLLFTAIISESVGSRFVIKKIN